MTEDDITKETLDDLFKGEWNEANSRVKRLFRFIYVEGAMLLSENLKQMKDTTINKQEYYNCFSNADAALVHLMVHLESRAMASGTTTLPERPSKKRRANIPGMIVTPTSEGSVNSGVSEMADNANDDSSNSNTATSNNKGGRPKGVSTFSIDNNWRKFYKIIKEEAQRRSNRGNSFSAEDKARISKWYDAALEDINDLIGTSRSADDENEEANAQPVPVHTSDPLPIIQEEEEEELFGGLEGLDSLVGV